MSSSGLNDDRVPMLDLSEQDRLSDIYSKLRDRLLDLSKKNRTLNYTFSSRSKRQLQIVDEVLENVYAHLTEGNNSFRIAHLPEPDAIPPEEKTKEFQNALGHARVSDMEYLAAIDEQANSGDEDESVMERIERNLRERVRQQLGLSPRTGKIEVNRDNHARSLGINPNKELPAVGTKDAHSDPLLQTMKYSEELEAVMARISDEARLAEQEAGISTLFLAFGFLEWYESDSSDKAYYAPLLLLPVKVEKNVVRNRLVFELSAREESAETNVSLQRFLETKFGKALPEFDEGETEGSGSVEDYFARVHDSIEGLKRWRIRRWLVLGHFAFNRISIYEDTKPERWKEPPVRHRLVKAMLSGFEDHFGDSSFHAPEDYQIDDSSIESIAPILIQDADASQHSALVDVMKGENLVIQGPPGTGKSQTIANIIANALNAGKTVLFLAEKQAALEVVKRRLDKAELGDFCLELHSDRSSPRAVTESLKRRSELVGSEPSSRSSLAREDVTWISSREHIGKYLKALHAETEDGRTPFDLMWKSIWGRSEYEDFGPGLSGVRIEEAQLNAPDKLSTIHGMLENFAKQAQDFEKHFGHPQLSPWSLTPPIDLPSYEINKLIRVVKSLNDSVAEIIALMKLQIIPGLSQPESVDVFAAREEAAKIISADDTIGVPPAADTLESIACHDLASLKLALTLQEEHLAAIRAVEDLSWPLDADATKLASVPALMAALPDKELALLTPSAIREHAENTIARDRRFIDLTEVLHPALADLDLDDTVSSSALNAVCVAAKLIARIVEKVPTSSLRWLSSDLDTEAFSQLYNQWKMHSQEEHELRVLVPNYTEDCWPDLTSLEAAIAILKKPFFGKIIGTMSGKNRIAAAMAKRLGLETHPLPADLMERVAQHIRSIAVFASSKEARKILGEDWFGMATQFDEIANGIELRAHLEKSLLTFPGGGTVTSRILSLHPSKLVEFSAHSGAASAFLAAKSEFDSLLSEQPLGEVTSLCRQRIAEFTGVIDSDAEKTLSEFDQPLSRLMKIQEATSLLTRKRKEVEFSGFSDFLSKHAFDAHGLKRTKDAITWADKIASTDLPNSVSAGLLSSEAGEWLEHLRDLADRYRKVFKAFDDASENVSKMVVTGMNVFTSVTQLSVHLKKLIDAENHISDFIALRRTRTALEKAGLTDFLEKTDETHFPPARLPGLFQATVAHALAKHAQRTSAALGYTNGSDLDANRRTFADHDRQKIDSDRKKLRDHLLQNKPPDGSNSGPRNTWTEMELLRNEFPKQKRFLPVRGLMRRAGEAVMTLKPCFMMSPLSLSKFLPTDQIQFDLLVIDEASQMKPEDALGAMLRARQVVVVGDPKQLPPTSFFDRSGEALTEDDEDEIDDESILERCQKVFRKVRRLKWHYRSRCESLIRFSNDNFYDSSLITFPAAKPDSFAIDLVRVNGEYMAHRNVAEAEKVVDEVIAFMCRFAECPEDKMPTLGVVSPNTEQKELIQETFRCKSSGNNLIEAYLKKATQLGEPFFVKNLENVQGDERDYIFISMTYGKGRGLSRMMQRFGPINRKSGHRRLNVLFSRARTRIGLFTSFGSEDVEPSDRSQEGVHILKRYLEYAESRGQAIATDYGGEADADSDFEIEVARRLTAHGYTVQTQVGASGFRIDLGIRHPDRPGMFLAGVECDGARYHSSKSARDRDRLREDVLRDKGWEILRVWSTDWFNNPDRQTEKLVKQIEELRAKSASSEAQEFTLNSTVVAAYEPEIVELDLVYPKIADAEVETEEPSLIVAEESEPADDGVALLSGNGPLTPEQARLALEALRDTVIARADAGWEQHRSILRDAMIETFISQSVTDPEDWFTRIPSYLRTSTNPDERHHYLESVCDVIARIRASKKTAEKPETRTSMSVGQGFDNHGASHTAPSVHITDARRYGEYRLADFSQAGLEAQRTKFYETDYRAVLRKIVAHVIETEAPIYRDVLAVRVARLHGIARTGGNVQKIIGDAVEKRFPRSHEEGREVVWPEGADTSALVPFRASPDTIRQHADIPLAELASMALPLMRIGLPDELVIERMADQFNLRRVRAATRKRFQASIELSRRHIGQT